MFKMRNLEILFVVGAILAFGNCQHIITDVSGEPPSTSGWSDLCTTTCDGQTIIGGYGCYDPGLWTQKTYDIPIAHSAVSIQFDAYWIDAWDGESLRLYVDGALRYSQSKSGLTGPLCGVAGYYDYKTTVYISPVPHNSSSLTLKFTSTLDEASTNESWGFKNIKITVWPVCDPACATCFGNLISECYSCNNGWYLSGSTCVTDCGANYWNDPSINNCSASCPDGYYPDSDWWQCVQCWQGSGPTLYSCATCSGGADNQCNSCNSGSFLYPNTEGQCMNPCPDGFWGDTSSRTCKPCYESASSPFTCKTCTAGSSSSCTSCNEGTFLYGSECLASCPDGYWADESTQICQPCYNNPDGSATQQACATCSGPEGTNCLTCFTGTYYFSVDMSCLSTCPPGYYPDASPYPDNLCRQCYQSDPSISLDGTCATCSGPDSNQCLTCPDGYWEDTTTNTCQPCYSSTAGPNFGCATCPGGGADNNCTSCYSGSFLYLSRCIRTCPSDYFGDTSTNECVPCYNGTSSPFACKTCLGQNSSDCTSCYSANYLYPSSQGECLSECPSRYWRDNSTNKCQQCSEDLSSISECAVAIEYKVVASNLQSAAMGSTSGITAVAASFQNSNSASGIFGVNLFLYVSVIESIANMQYLNINHSQIASDSYAGLSKSFIPNWISNRFNSIDENLLVFKYGIFEKKQISALYLDNYGGLLTETFIYAGLCLLGIPLVLKLKTPDKLPSSILGKMYALVFGILLSNLFGHIQSQILFSVLQILKTDLFIDTYPKVSYSMACVTIYVVLLLLLLSYCKLRAIFAFKEKQKKEASNPNLEVGLRHNKLEDSAKLLWTEKQYEMIFRNLKDDRKNAFFFFYWVILYNTIFIILILSLQSIPVLQCLSIAILTIGLLIFSAVLKPMKGKSAAILFFFNYICIAFIAIINLVLAIRDALDSQTIDNDRVGWVIFITISLNSGVNLLASICELFYVMYLSAKIIKAWCLKSGDKVKEETVSKKRGFEQNKTAHKTNPSALSAESNKQSSMVLEKEGWQRTLQMNFFKYSKFKILQRLQNREFALQNDGSRISESKPKEKASSKIDLGNRETFQEANYAIDLNTSSFNATRPEMLEVHIPSLVDPDSNLNTRKNTRLRRYREARI